MQEPTHSTPGLTAIASTDEILEKPQTAERLKVSTRTLDEWMRAGRVPYLKIGKSVRFRWSDVLAHLQHNNRVN
ncbi:MAG: helix-turn-helix domain-containing protein [Verrucomicrobiota bacterium]